MVVQRQSQVRAASLYQGTKTLPLACNPFKPQSKSLLHFSVTTSIYQQQRLCRLSHQQLSGALFLRPHHCRPVLSMDCIAVVSDGQTRSNPLTAGVCFTAATLTATSLDRARGIEAIHETCSLSFAKPIPQHQALSRPFIIQFSPSARCCQRLCSLMKRTPSHPCLWRVGIGCKSL